MEVEMNHDNFPRCGTGGSGCTGPAMSHFSDSMCNGVFAPVCAPEICNVPRMPHQEKLVEGEGYFWDKLSNRPIKFMIFIERIMEVYKGHIGMMYADDNEMIMNTEMLKFFEGNGETYMMAVFHGMMPERNIIITARQTHLPHDDHAGTPGEIYAYSSPLEMMPLNLGGKLFAGEIKFYEDHMVHEH